MSLPKSFSNVPWSRALTTAQRANSLRKEVHFATSNKLYLQYFPSGHCCKTEITRQPGTFKAENTSGLQTSKLTLLSSSFTTLQMSNVCSVLSFSLLLVLLCLFILRFCFHRRMLFGYWFNLFQTYKHQTFEGILIILDSSVYLHQNILSLLHDNKICLLTYSYKNDSQKLHISLVYL